MGLNYLLTRRLVYNLHQNKDVSVFHSIIKIINIATNTNSAGLVDFSLSVSVIWENDDTGDMQMKHTKSQGEKKYFDVFIFI